MADRRMSNLSRMAMIFAVGFLLVVPSVVLSGSVCPPRSEIYPCSCANVSQGKRRVATVVTCHRVQDSASLEDIYPGLRAMEIDQFHLVDSFWGQDGEGAALPPDWLTLHKMREIEIADSTLASCFMCRWRMNCRNSVTTRFAVTNSSSSEKMCSVCDTFGGRSGGVGKQQPWTGCMSRLREFSYSRGRLASLGADLFPLAMRELESLNLTRNQIVKVDPSAFRNLPALLSLDLSHNAIEHIDHLFAGQVVRLEHLDISWNFVKILGADLFSSLPRVKRLEAGNNLLVDMKEGEWKNAPNTLKYIDLRDNPLHCDCGVRWVNASFSVNTVLLASCSSPPEYSRSPLRRASRFLTERCTPGGVLGTRPPSTTGRPTTTEAPRLKKKAL